MRKALKLKNNIQKTNFTKQSEVSAKLPKVELPIFIENYMERMLIKDYLLLPFIHKNVTLLDVQKLKYLKLSLKVSASTLIQAMEITDEN